MNLNAILAVAFLALLGAAYVYGHHAGTASLQARLDAAAVQAQAADMETAKALAVAEQARAALSQQLQDAANADPVTVPVALPATRVLRLQAARQ